MDDRVFECSDVIKAATTQLAVGGYKPLDTIDFRSDVERGQQLLDWQDECEGMCGV